MDEPDDNMYAAPVSMAPPLRGFPSGWLITDIVFCSMRLLLSIIGVAIWLLMPIPVPHLGLQVGDLIAGLATGVFGIIGNALLLRHRRSGAGFAKLAAAATVGSIAIGAIWLFASAPMSVPYLLGGIAASGVRIVLLVVYVVMVERAADLIANAELSADRRADPGRRVLVPAPPAEAAARGGAAGLTPRELRIRAPTAPGIGQDGRDPDGPGPRGRHAVAPARSPRVSAPLAAPPPPSDPEPVAPLPGYINGRYEVLDAVDDWTSGSLYRVADHRSGQRLRAARIGRWEAVDGGAVARLAAIAAGAPERTVPPLRLLEVRSFRARSSASDLTPGDAVLLFADAGTAPMLLNRIFTGRQVSFPAALRVLRALGVILDQSARTGQDLGRLSMEHIHLDASGQPVLYLLAPFLPDGDHGGEQRLLAADHPRGGDPATQIAVASCVLLSEPLGRHRHFVHQGVHHPIPTLPYAANQLLAGQLARAGGGVHASAGALLDALHANHRVRPQDYLTPDQLRWLQAEGVREDGDVLAVIRVAVERTRPGVHLFNDQTPRPLADQDLRDALAAISVNEQRERRGTRQQRLGRALWISAGCASVLLMGCWLFGNRAGSPVFQEVPAPIARGMHRGAFTTGSSFSASFPTPIHYAPARASNLAYYHAVQATRSDVLRLLVSDDRGGVIARYAMPQAVETGYVFVHFSLEGRADVRALTAQAFLGSTLLQEQRIEVADPWFASFGRTVAVVIAIWLVASIAQVMVIRRL